MVWNKDLPSGSKAGNLLDDDVRANNAALETAFDEEHVFSTGGDQTGKHQFAVEHEAIRDADSDYVAGSISFLDDVVSGYPVGSVFDGTDWFTFLAPFLNYQNDWVKGQLYTPVALTPGASVASDWTAANVFTLAIDQDSTLSNPTVTGLADKGAVRFYIITQDDPARTLSYGSLFSQDGINSSTGPALDTTVGSVNIFMAVLNPDDPVAMIHITRLLGPASDAQAKAGTSESVAITPANLGSNFDATNSAGYVELIGTGKLLQWIQAAIPADLTVLTFATPFANTNYTISWAAIDDTWPQYVSWEILTTSTIKIHVGSGFDMAHIMAIGDAP